MRGNKILIFAPHNDDEILATGGVLQQYVDSGNQVTVALMTNGDGQVRRPPITPIPRQDFVKLGYMRQRETLKALKCLGLGEEKVEFLGYPDRGLSSMWTINWRRDNLYYSKYTESTHSPYDNSYTKETLYCGSAVVEDVRRLMLNREPDVVYLPHPNDLHPDHWATNGFVLYGLEQLKKEEYSAFGKVKMMSYLVHSLKYPRPRGKNLNAALSVPSHFEGLDTEWREIALTPDERQRKLRAIRRHRTQTRLMRQYLVSFARANELFGLVPSLSLDNTAEYEAALTLSRDTVKKEENIEPISSYIDPKRKRSLISSKRYPKIHSVQLSKNSDRFNLAIKFLKKLRPAYEIQISIKPFSTGQSEITQAHTYQFQANKAYHNGTEIGNNDGDTFDMNGLCCRISIPLQNMGAPCKLILSLTLVRKGVPFARIANRLVKL